MEMWSKSVVVRIWCGHQSLLNGSLSRRLHDGFSPFSPPVASGVCYCVWLRCAGCSCCLDGGEPSVSSITSSVSLVDGGEGG